MEATEQTCEACGESLGVFSHNPFRDGPALCRRSSCKQAAEDERQERLAEHRRDLRREDRDDD